MDSENSLSSAGNKTSWGVEMSDKTKRIHCETHGGRYATYVCCHLVEGSNLGFFCADDPDDERPDAWCGACDRVLLEEGEWNARSEGFAQVALICSECYDVVRERNKGRRKAKGQGP
jgi:hypothetical protein